MNQSINKLKNGQLIIFNDEEDELQFIEKLSIQYLSIYSCNHIKFNISSKSLISLKINNSYVRTLKFISQLTQLWILELNNVQLKQIKPLSYLHNLRNLSLRGNKLLNIDGIQMMTNLLVLNLSEVQTDVKNFSLLPIKQLSRLIQLNLYSCSVKTTNFLPNNLKLLNISCNSKVDIQSIKDHNLHQLIVDHCQLADIEVICQQKDLVELNLQRNLGIDISFLKNLQKLFKLNLCDFSLTEIGIISELSVLRELELSDNKIENITPIQTLVNLWKLTLNRNNISNIQPLRTLVRMKTLELANNPLTDISALCTMKNLRVLEIYKTNVNSIEPLQELTELTELVLHNNKISDISPLKELKKLKMLDLRQNSVYSLHVLRNHQYVDNFLIKQGTDFDFTKNREKQQSRKNSSLIEMNQQQHILQQMGIINIQSKFKYVRQTCIAQLQQQQYSLIHLTNKLISWIQQTYSWHE
ncbi:leucine-rich_repeat domain-containing protein [Hexamita inflata]|uniref:Leucine-rich repeat domain-containing protein n=1 Tax=Hexamita inflata TaxID=28002 RepID=A0AA86Q0W5_9EUKA|nr:leucine-rich repeat domain-containing protein [Hexamita inflata]